MNKAILLAALGFLTVAIAPTAQAATITLFNTGVDSAGVPLPNGSLESHYSLVSVPSGGTTGIKVLTSVGGFPVGPWIGDNSTSAWIGPNTSQANGLGGLYDYQTTFSLTGLDASTASIIGQWSSDNAGVQIFLNGVDIGPVGNPYGTSSNYSFQQWATFSINSGFVSGLNKLDFFVTNGNGSEDTFGPTGLRVEMTGMASAVPEPSTWAMMILGFLGVGFMAYHRKTAVA